MTRSEGDSRMSSVSGLKLRPEHGDARTGERADCALDEGHELVGLVMVDPFDRLQDVHRLAEVERPAR